MRTTSKRRFAWATLAAALALYCGALALDLAGPPAGASGWGSSGPVGRFLVPTALLAFPVVGGIVAARRPDNTIGWILLAAGVAWSWIFFVEAYAAFGLIERPGSVPAPLHVGATSLALWVPGVGLPATLLLQLFPDGRALSIRWRRYAWFTGGVLLVVFLQIAVEESPVASIPGTENPYALDVLQPLIRPLAGVTLLFPVCLIGSVACLVLRHRRSGPQVRQQVKWLAYAGAVAAMSLASATLATYATEGPGGRVPLPVTILQDMVLVGVALIPIAVGVAVLRYRLYDIDRIISRTLSYVLITAVLGAIFVGVVLVPTTLVGIGGASPDWLVAVATLVVAALFRPVRRRVQGAIDRRFNRARYDAAHTMEAFASRLRDEVDIDTLGTELSSVVRSTMQPTHVTLWIKGRPSAR